MIIINYINLSYDIYILYKFQLNINANNIQQRPTSPVRVCYFFLFINNIGILEYIIFYYNIGIVKRLLCQPCI